MNKWIIIGITVLLGAGILWWAVKESTKPLPGKDVSLLTRNHIPVGTKVSYNSNPPTSGDHYEEWTRSGIYDKPVADGYLIHSLEHGYVIISYNCRTKEQGFVGSVYAADSQAGNDASTSGNLSGQEWESASCKSLQKNLADLANGKRLWKLIVVPRPNLDTRIALAAWGKIDKFNSFDKERIIKFIDGSRDRGPEQTME